MLGKQTIRDVNLYERTVLLRADYNVPIKDGKIESNLRIRSSLPTIEYLIEKNVNKIIIISHLGRPEGKINPEFSLKPVAEELKYLLPEKNVIFINSLIGLDVAQKIKDAPYGSIILLENLRFYPEEEKNSSSFAEDIIKTTGANLFVQDGFAVMHRAHASTQAITRKIPSVAGLLVEKEINTLSIAMESPPHPVLVIVGGAKVADKQPMIDNLLHLSDHIFIGGKIAADGYRSDNPKIYVASDFHTDESGAKLDIGPKSILKAIDLIDKSRTIIWNGTVGLAENPEFREGTLELARAIGHHDSMSIICGGDTSGFIENLQLEDSSLRYSLVSTGGGAALEFLSGSPLPGYIALLDQEN